MTKFRIKIYATIRIRSPVLLEWWVSAVVALLTLISKLPRRPGRPIIPGAPECPLTPIGPGLPLIKNKETLIYLHLNRLNLNRLFVCFLQVRHQLHYHRELREHQSIQLILSLLDHLVVLRIRKFNSKLFFQIYPNVNDLNLTNSSQKLKKANVWDAFNFPYKINEHRLHLIFSPY